MTEQAPIPSGFGLRTPAAEVLKDIDLSGKTALVTGGYSGLGRETVRALADAGAAVIVGARRPGVAAEDLKGIANVTILPLDLADPASIDAFAAQAADVTGRIDMLINNAAIMANPLTRDARGYESQFSTNHLGHFQLTARLLPLLKAAAPGARVVALSSIGHARNGLDLSDVSFERRDYDKWTAYAQAKSANALFAFQLDKLGAAQGIRAFSVHPGGIKTPLQRHLTMEEQVAMGWYKPDGTLADIFKTPEQGVATSVWCATSPMLDGKGGVYCEDCDIAPMWAEGMNPYAGARPHIGDPVLAEGLWRMSEAMTGARFDW